MVYSMIGQRVEAIVSSVMYQMTGKRYTWFFLSTELQANEDLGLEVFLEYMDEAGLKTKWVCRRPYYKRASPFTLHRRLDIWVFET
jgi:hypothetical protein